MEKELTDEQKMLILSNETEQKFGYRIESLSYGSSRFIIHKCKVCGDLKETRYQYFVKDIYATHRKCGRVQAKKTFLKKYGVENPSLCPEVLEKIRQTNLTRYGVEYPQQSLEIQAKKEQTNIEKYGSKSPLQNLQIQEKIKQSNREKYGVENPSQRPEIRTKAQQTNLERFGIINPSSLSMIRKKVRQTLIERYNIENPSQIPGIQDKIKQSILLKYGVERFQQLPEYRNRLKNWCVENPNKLHVSKSELEILGWIRSFYLSAKKYKDGVYEVDILIPELNLGIEHNGLFYHEEGRVVQRYHLNKTKHFEAKNIRIIHIFEHEWKNNQEQVKSFLLSAIGKNEYKIGARKCTLLWSALSEDVRQVHDFLEAYHIQGRSINTKYVIKVLYNNELLAVATFGRHHRNNNNWVLTRFCTKTNYTIQGVLSRISNLASQQLKEDIISWADYRLSQGNGYEKAGWIFEELLPPDYFYHKGLKVFSKQSRQKKKVNTPKGMTEKQHAQMDGLRRVYDCGKIRYKYKYNNLRGERSTLFLI